MEAKLGFLQVEVEGVFRNAFALGKAMLGIGPKGLDTVDVRLLIGKLIDPMVNAEVFGITHVDEPVISAPSVSVDTLSRSIRPRITGIKSVFAASGTISVKTFPFRLKMPNTIVFPPAPRPRFPRTRLGPK